MSRASSSDVRAVVSTDTALPLADIEPYIRHAGSLTSKVASNDSGSLLDANDLRSIETYLAAHFYALFDLQFKVSKAKDASAVFQTGADEKGPLNSTIWGKQAMLLDVTGYLANLNQDAVRGKSKITLRWLGKPPSTQIDYIDRD